MKELEVTLKIRNNLLKERRLHLGFNQVEMAIAIGIPYHVYNGFENMSHSPVSSNGEWIPYALETAEYFDCPIEDIFPPALLKIEKPKSVKKLDFNDLCHLMSDHSKQLSIGQEQRLIEDSEEKTRNFLTNRSISLLGPNETKIISGRFGFGGKEPKTIDELSKEVGLSRERTRQILDIASKKVGSEISRSLKGEKRFIIYYQNVFEEGVRQALTEKVRDELLIEFPSVVSVFHQRNWMPFLVATKAYGFEDEVKEVQEKVDSITSSVLKSGKWPLKRKKKRKTSSLPEGVKSSHFSRSLLTEKINVGDDRYNHYEYARRAIFIASRRTPKAVIITCSSYDTAFKVAETINDSLDKSFDYGICKSIYDDSVGRTIIVFKNGSSIDLICIDKRLNSKKDPKND